MEAAGAGSDHGRGGRGGRYFGGASAAMAAQKEKEAAIKRQGLREDISRELADVRRGAYMRSGCFSFGCCALLLPHLAVLSVLALICFVCLTTVVVVC